MGKIIFSWPGIKLSPRCDYGFLCQIRISSRQFPPKPGFGALKCLTFAMTLTLNTAIQSFQKTLLLMMKNHQTNLVAERISSSKEQSYLDYMNSYCHPDLEDSKQLFCMTLCSWWLHHHNYGVQSFVTKGSTVQKISGWPLIEIMNPDACNFDLEHNNPFFSRKCSSLWWCTIQSIAEALSLWLAKENHRQLSILNITFRQNDIHVGLLYWYKPAALNSEE